MSSGFSRVFTLEVDGRPTLAFEASGTKEAALPRIVASQRSFSVDVGRPPSPYCEIQAFRAAGVRRRGNWGFRDPSGVDCLANAARAQTGIPSALRKTEMSGLAPSASKVCVV